MLDILVMEGGMMRLDLGGLGLILLVEILKDALREVWSFLFNVGFSNYF